MIKKFNLQTIYKPDYTSDINGNVFNYIEDLILNELLIPKKIIVGGVWNYVFSFNVMISRSTDAIKVNQLIMWDLKHIKNELIKYSGATCPSVLFSTMEMNNEHIKEFIKLLFESLKLFFEQNFKKITRNDVDGVFKKIDWEHIFNLTKLEDLNKDKILFNKPLNR